MPNKNITLRRVKNREEQKNRRQLNSMRRRSKIDQDRRVEKELDTPRFLEAIAHDQGEPMPQLNWPDTIRGDLPANISDVIPPTKGYWKEVQFITITPSPNPENTHP